MGDKSAIQWTDATWNCFAAFNKETGKRGWMCVLYGDDCTNCYAQDMNKGPRGNGLPYVHKSVEKVDIKLVNLTLPISWQRPRKIFTNSMTDMFFESHTYEQIAAVHGIMAAAPRHTFITLTKRTVRAMNFYQWLDEQIPRSPWPKEMPSQVSVCLEYALCEIGKVEHTLAHYSIIMHSDCTQWPLPNQWLLASTGSQKEADQRVGALLLCPAVVHGISYEPALGPLTLKPEWCITPNELLARSGNGARSVLAYKEEPHCNSKIDWVIIGGESGPKARPFNIDWGSWMIDQCQANKIPVFMKQMGEKPYYSQVAITPDASHFIKFADKKGGKMEEWPISFQIREYPHAQP